jgi:serine/threonine protein phosphatase PrpC
MHEKREANLEIGHLSHRGRVRNLNEDYVAYRVPEDAALLAQRGALFVVADGMGGHAAGEVASKTAVETAIRTYYEDAVPDVEESLRAAVQAANAAVYERAQQQRTESRMGTTFVGAVVRGNTLHIANVGDSRAYLIRDGEVEQITEDHSWVQEQVRAGVLSEEERRKHPRRSVITRALGIQPHVEVDIFRRTMEPGDVLVLCSDGLWEQVEDGEIGQTVRSHPPEEAAQRLIELANGRGGPDNISLIVLRRPAPERASAEIPATARVAAPTPRAPAPRRRRLGLAVIGLAVAVLVVVGAVGTLVTSRGGTPSTPRVVPTTGATTQPPAGPVGITPGPTERAADPTSPPLATATLRPTLTRVPTSRPTLAAQPAAPTPIRVPGSATPAPPNATPFPVATATGETPSPSNQGGSQPPVATQDSLGPSPSEPGLPGPSPMITARVPLSGDGP